MKNVSWFTHLLTLMSFPACEKRRHFEEWIFVHTMKVSRVQCCFGPPLTFTCMNNERFGTALVWVNEDKIIIFEWSITLKWLRCVKMQTCCIYIICHSFRWILLFTLSIYTSTRYGTLFETAKNGVNPSRHLCTGPYVTRSPSSFHPESSTYTNTV